MDCPTKEQLIIWRQQGMSNVAIAEKTGETPNTINCLFSKYKIARKKKTITQEETEAICRMKREGAGTKEIAEKLGHAESTVYLCLKAAGLVMERNLEPELPMIFAVQRIPKITKVTYFGVRYEDVTGFVIKS